MKNYESWTQWTIEQAKMITHSPTIKLAQKIENIHEGIERMIERTEAIVLLPH